jgi:hypothetical protein
LVESQATAWTYHLWGIYDWSCQLARTNAWIRSCMAKLPSKSSTWLCPRGLSQFLASRRLFALDLTEVASRNAASTTRGYRFWRETTYQQATKDLSIT